MIESCQEVYQEMVLAGEESKQLQREEFFRVGERRGNKQK
jgi:hypothetical protein